MNKTKVLFLCTHNSTRSQLAEGLLRHFYGDKYEVFSAGTNPTHVNPLAVRAMSEIGIDISKQYSKSIEVFSDVDIDLAVTVCQNSSKTICALCGTNMIMDRPEVVYTKLHKTKRYLFHGFSDPSEVEGTEEDELTAFRRVRDEMKDWIVGEFANLKVES
ncbi:MAG TPA: arsenate reductase ArsC [Verrucomicrobiae bacterium]|nr:arsenate reductase ArsC [Verrucomicrobiae bacterium]